MRRQTLRLATTTRKRITISTRPLRLHCPTCGHPVDTVTPVEAELLSQFLPVGGPPHPIVTPEGSARICCAWITAGV